MFMPTKKYPQQGGFRTKKCQSFKTFSTNLKGKHWYGGGGSCDVYPAESSDAPYQREQGGGVLAFHRCKRVTWESMCGPVYWPSLVVCVTSLSVAVYSCHFLRGGRCLSLLSCSLGLARRDAKRASFANISYRGVGVPIPIIYSKPKVEGLGQGSDLTVKEDALLKDGSVVPLPPC